MVWKRLMGEYILGLELQNLRFKKLFFADKNLL